MMFQVGLPPGCRCCGIRPGACAPARYSSGPSNIREWCAFLRGGDHQFGQILGTRHVLAGQAGRIDEVRVGHAERRRFGVHGGHHGRHAARIVAAQRVGGSILGRHQRQVHEIAAGQYGAHGEPRNAAFRQIAASACGDFERLIQRLLGVEHHQRGHQLGDGRDRCRDVRMARIQNRRIALIDDEHRTRLEFRCETSASQSR